MIPATGTPGPLVDSLSLRALSRGRFFLCTTPFHASIPPS
jgi:hypothetical protein